jgi:hypothetical protein
MIGLPSGARVWLACGVTDLRKTTSFLTTLILSGVLTIPVRLAAQSSSSEVITFDATGPYGLGY